MAPRFEDLRAEYANLWRTMQIRPERAAAVAAIANHLIGFKSRYQAVSARTGVPWFMIAVLHQRESDANFSTHLHNGDPLSARTRHVPAGRPPGGSPPFTWEESAIDALTMPGHTLNLVPEWTIERICYEIEKYNGFGYRNNHPSVKSPYLWSFSSHYQSGKYVADGVFDPNAVDKQCGTMPLLKHMVDAKEIDMTDSFRTTDVITPPVPEPFAVLSVGSRGDRVVQLQTALERRGFAVGGIDGIYGSATRDAVAAFQRASKLQPTGIADGSTQLALADVISDPGPLPNVFNLPIKPEDLLKVLLGTFGGGLNLPGPKPGPDPAANPLQLLLKAFLGAAQPPGAGGNAPILSPIDKLLGGETLAGKKTAIAIGAYVVMALLQATGVVASATPAGMVVNVLIMLLGGLGGMSKIDRVIQAMGMIATKRVG